MRNFKIFLQNENKITTYQKVCDNSKISKEVYTALSAYNQKNPTINNLSFYISKLVKEKKKQRKNKSKRKPMTLKKGRPQESSPTPQFKTSILRHSAFFTVQLSHPYT